MIMTKIDTAGPQAKAEELPADMTKSIELSSEGGEIGSPSPPFSSKPSSGPDLLLDPTPELLVNVIGWLSAKGVRRLRQVKKQIKLVVDTNSEAVGPQIRRRERARLKA